ncbi:hypothetical protein AYI69_g1057 [Smittium culicis]|uniref:Uncharacterized protein n=1 Tax=Smittium culicis TaxID=133412 RepID=A0A1R1YRF4_9FUNG|nr:hypothetical protein AYI69_g1057 [Smittium culicis]
MLRMRSKFMMVPDNLVNRLGRTVTIPGYEVFHNFASRYSMSARNLGEDIDYGETPIKFLNMGLDNLEDPCIIAGDFSMSNSARRLPLYRRNGDKTWTIFDRIIVSEAAKGLISNAKVKRG